MLPIDRLGEDGSTADAQLPQLCTYAGITVLEIE